MLQDKFLPQYDVSKTESITINADPKKIFPFIDTLDFRTSKRVYWLFKLRGIPVPESMSLEGLKKINFEKLDAIKNKETIVGLIGQFWTKSGNLISFSPEEFVDFKDENFAKATWNFELVPLSDNQTELFTETRVYCQDPVKKRKFIRYWKIIQPFSSFIRRAILKSIKEQAERV